MYRWRARYTGVGNFFDDSLHLMRDSVAFVNYNLFK
jgi:hypothetical protein